MRTGWAISPLSLVLAVVTGMSWAQGGPGSLQVTVPSSTMQTSGTQTLTAKRVFFRAPSRAITVRARWYSSNQSVATVNVATGAVSSLATGTTTITAVSGPFVARAAIVVVPPGNLNSITITPSSNPIPKGLTSQFTAMGDFSGTPQDITAVVSWNSSNTAVAPINTAGLAQGANAGSADMKASLNSVLSNTATLTVTAPALQSVVVTPTPVFMAASVPQQASTFQLHAIGVWTDGARDETSNAAWSSSADPAATVNNTTNKGLVTGVGNGGSHNNNIATITASLSDTLGNTRTNNSQVSVMTVNEAGRFLEQATFGPSPADVAHLQSMGFDAWLNEQFNMSQLNSIYPAAPDIPTVQNQFYLNALTAPDQLRQRAAFALEQIWVISSNKVTDPNAFVPWQNMMERDVFGNYKDLMTDVTLSPAMGLYLDMVNNDKPATGANPNENYARELLQLFTIGLYKLDSTGAQLLNNGNPIPTYDENVVQGFAHVFTGWTYPTRPGQVLQKHNPSYYGVPPYGSPMEVLATNHDTANTKLLLNGTTLPMGQTAGKDLSDAMNNIFNDPTIGPFICKQLIEHLVKSNPTPTYVQNVVNVFNDDGTTTRGNLKAVLKAILMDDEARAGDFQVFPDNTDSKEGHLREPVLFMTSILRGLNSTDTGTSLAGRDDAMGENILDSPTVFNFFPPDYVIPQNYFTPTPLPGIVGPEFALQTPTTAVNRANFVSTVVFGSLRASVLATLNSYNSLASSSPSALVDALNLRLMHGQMSVGMGNTIINAVSAYPPTSASTRVQTAVYLILSSSQYQVQH